MPNARVTQQHWAAWEPGDGCRISPPLSVGSGANCWLWGIIAVPCSVSDLHAKVEDLTAALEFSPLI